MKKVLTKLISLALALTITASSLMTVSASPAEEGSSLSPAAAGADTAVKVAESSMPFTDVTPERWFYSDVEYAYQKELMNGISETEFNPSGTCTRGMIVTILYRAEKSPAVGKNSFTDVPYGKYYTNAVSWAQENAIVGGYGDGKFGPNDNVTRQQLAAILYRFCEYKKRDVSERADLSKFTDNQSISNFAWYPMSWANAVGLINGMTDTELAPKQNATRAQIAAMLKRLLDKILIHTITFYINESEIYTTLTVNTGDYITLPDEPSLDGYAFTGWYYDKEAQIQFSAAPIGCDISLYAGWKQEIISVRDVILINDPSYSPDSAEAEKDCARRATTSSHYRSDENPIINRDRQQNKQTLPSFDMDSTGFVRGGTKLSDFKGKTLCFYTPDNRAQWSYRNSRGETIDEWRWFSGLKSELGINIKYTVSRRGDMNKAALRDMNVGNKLDIIYTNGDSLLQSLYMSRSLTDLININDNLSSPGVSKATMDACKYGNSYRIIAPTGDIDILWYNQTLTQQLNLSDPRVMWEKGAWNWDSFRKYMQSAPKTNFYGDDLVAFMQNTPKTALAWAATSGSDAVSLLAGLDKPALSFDWNEPETAEAWEFISSVCTNIKFGSSEEDLNGLFLGNTLMVSGMDTLKYVDTEYSKHVQINWVPYPKASNEKGRDVSILKCRGMLLPRKTVSPDDVNCALKFMELWATRFTECIYDDLHTFEYINFNYKQRKQHWDFATLDNLCLLDLSASKCTDFFKALESGSPSDVKIQAEKASEYISEYIESALSI